MRHKLGRIKFSLLAKLIEQEHSGTLRQVALKKYLADVSRFGRHHAPPEAEIFVGRGEELEISKGGGDYLQIGKAFFRHFVELGGLRRADKVLDIGCGQGRMAIPLTRYLSSGQYEGIDIVPAGIDWCKHAFAAFPNFHFQRIDAHNQCYNPQGQLRASEYRFPFPDNHFDFVFLTSVFTHLLPHDLEHYFAEIARVLKPGGEKLYYLFSTEPRVNKFDGKRTRV